MWYVTDFNEPTLARKTDGRVTFCQAAPKELLTLKSFNIEYEDELDYATIKSKSPLVRPIDPSITCVSEKNACILSFNLIVSATCQSSL